MALCSFSDGNALMGHTSVSNMFLLEYMPSAPAEYVKVYLYALMLCSYPASASDLETMASLLHMDCDTVKNAFSHWEREGLVVKLSDNPPCWNLLPLSPSGSASVDPEDGVYSNRGYNRSLQSLMPSLVLEGYELRTASDWVDVLGLSEEAIMLMVKQEVEKRGGKLPAAHTMFKHLDNTAKEWAEAGVTDLASAEAYISKSSAAHGVAQAVLRQFGQKRAPSIDETALVKKWTEEWNLSKEQIVAACAETVKANNPSFGYLDKVLESRRGEDDDPAREKIKKLCVHLGISNRPTPAMLQALKSFEEMGFEFAAIEQAAAWCGENNRRTFDDIAKKLSVWKDMGAFTVAEIEEERKVQNHFVEIVNKVFAAAGIDRKVTSADIKLVKVWTALMPEETVLYAAECSVGTETPMRFINKLIQSWSAQGITALDKAKAAQASFKPEAKPGVKTKEFDEREIKDSEFEQGYYADIMNRKKREDK